MNIDIDNLKKRILYRSQYRGTREMDKLLYTFVSILYCVFNRLCIGVICFICL